MHIFSRLIALAAATSLCGQALSAPINTIHVSPGNVNDIIITSENTINATAAPPVNGTVSVHSFIATPSTERLPLALVNNFPGGNINAYVTGLDSQGRLVMLTPQGTFFYPSCNPGEQIPQSVNANVAIPLGPRGSTTSITIPSYISSARIWFAAGELHFYTTWQVGATGPSLTSPSANNPKDPSSAVNWGFVELTNNESGGLYANLSYVDFVGLVLGLSMVAGDGSVHTALGLHANAIPTICQSLLEQTNKDGQPWSDLCQTASAPGSPLRIIAPIDYISVKPTAFQSYFTSYIDQVWSHYTTNILTISTQSDAGDVACKVSNNVLSCAGDNRAYAKPSAADIFGCNSGPFGIIGSDNGLHRAVVPRLCAAFNRGTLLIDGGNVQPGVHAYEYYKQGPANWYSAFVHANQVDGRGYAFSYDDVSPNGGVDQSGTVANKNPKLLTVVVGGPQ
jgi:hypothetical protein